MILILSFSWFILTHGRSSFLRSIPKCFFYDTQFLYRMNKTQDSCHVMLEADELYVVT